MAIRIMMFLIGEVTGTIIAIALIALLRANKAADIEWEKAEKYQQGFDRGYDKGFEEGRDFINKLKEL